eukprot:scaffold301_cov243-Pinguiococcus_pyrenoidosus.AAC.158
MLSSNESLAPKSFPFVSAKESRATIPKSFAAAAGLGPGDRRRSVSNAFPTAKLRDRRRSKRPGVRWGKRAPSAIHPERLCYDSFGFFPAPAALSAGAFLFAALFGDAFFAAGALMSRMSKLLRRALGSSRPGILSCQCFFKHSCRSLTSTVSLPRCADNSAAVEHTLAAKSNTNFVTNSSAFASSSQSLASRWSKCCMRTPCGRPRTP